MRSHFSELPIFKSIISTGFFNFHILIVDDTFQSLNCVVREKIMVV